MDVCIYFLKQILHKMYVRIAHSSNNGKKNKGIFYLSLTSFRICQCIADVGQPALNGVISYKNLINQGFKKNLNKSMFRRLVKRTIM